MPKKTISISTKTDKILNEMANISAYIDQTILTTWNNTANCLKLLIDKGIETDEIKQIVECLMSQSFPVSDKSLMIEIAKCKDKQILKLEEHRLRTLLQDIAKDDSIALAFAHLTTDYWNGNTWLKHQLSN